MFILPAFSGWGVACLPQPWLAFGDTDAVDDEMRGTVARNWPHLLAKLPPKEGLRLRFQS